MKGGKHMKRDDTMRSLRAARWHSLTTGQKVLKVITSIIKVALIVTVVGVVAAVVLGAATGIIMAFGIASAIAGGFADASRVYRPGDQYVRWF